MGTQARIGATKLMQQCTEMIKTRMYGTAATTAAGKQQNGSPEAQQNLEYLQPIVENVLSGLTAEYEKRLLRKDNELGLAKENFIRWGFRLKSPVLPRLLLPPACSSTCAALALIQLPQCGWLWMCLTHNRVGAMAHHSKPNIPIIFDPFRTSAGCP
jgi:hypothetical protein